MNMMPGIDFFELVILVVVAIVVIGPKELPLMMRKFGRFTGKMRSMAFEFKQGFDELGRQAELEELRKEVADLKKHTGMEDLQREFEEDRINLQRDVDSAMAPAQVSAQPAPALPPASPDSSASGTAAPATANGAETPAIAPYSGLSADHPGYDTGEDFKLEGHGPSPEPAPAPAPVKQETPA